MWLIVANGETISKDKTKELAKDKQVLVLDGGHAFIKKTDIQINTLLGDFDSIDPVELKSIKENPKVKLVAAPDQNQTDLEKALQHLGPKTDITIICALGKDFDHSLYNLLLLKKFHNKKRSLKIITDNQEISYLKDESIELNSKKNKTISLFGFPQASVSSNGLRYELQNLSVNFFYKSSARNCITKNKALVNIEGEAILIIGN